MRRGDTHRCPTCRMYIDERRFQDGTKGFAGRRTIKSRYLIKFGMNPVKAKCVYQ